MLLFHESPAKLHWRSSGCARWDKAQGVAQPLLSLAGTRLLSSDSDPSLVFTVCGGEQVPAGLLLFGCAGQGHRLGHKYNKIEYKI